MTFGERIRQARDVAGITQNQLAVSLGTTNTTVSNWEKGISKPYADMLSDLCRILSVDANWLLGYEIASPSHTFAARRLADIYDNELNDDGQRQLTDYADDLVQSGKYKKGAAGAKNDEKRAAG